MRRLCGKGALCVALMSFCLASHALADGSEPEGATGFTAKPAVRADGGMVVTANPHASEAAAAVMQAGGNAFDAAMTAILVLNVVEPQSAGIGGGGFLLHRAAGTGQIVAWDGRETAPREVDEQLFLGEQGKPLPFFEAVVGGRSVGVPGLVRMLQAAHAEHGRLPWRDLFEPAINLAESGFEVSPRLHALLQRDRFLRRDASARDLFYTRDGAALPVGARLRNPALAQTLRLLAEEGADAMYVGPLADDIVAAVRSEPNPGHLSAADLRDYQPVQREALCGGYREVTVCGMPPPSSGGSTVLAMLGMLERFDLGSPDLDSAFVTHLFLEAGRLAYADRDAWLGDPDGMRVPVEALFADAYLSDRAALISLTDSQKVASPGQPAKPSAPRVLPAPERLSTTHVSVVDSDSNAVALTASIENAFGSRRMVRGFLLNNQLTDFSFQPYTQDDSPHPNRVASGRRPLSSMAPTLVLGPDGDLFAVTGSPGGPRIIQYVAASVIGLVDGKLAPDALLARPHAGSLNGPTVVEDSEAGKALAKRLKAFGQEPVLRDMTSGLAVIVRDGDAWVGAADPRREGTAVGVSR